MFRFLTFLAWKQLKARSRQAGMLVLSVAVGVAILTTALSLTNGFEQDLIRRILGTTPHVTLTDPIRGTIENVSPLLKTLEKEKNVQAATPFINGKALLVTSYGTEGAIVRGIDPQLEGRDPQWASFVLVGDLPDQGVMLGSELAKRLGIGIGERLTLFTGRGKASLLVTGIFQAGLYEYDAHVAFLTIPRAQSLFRMSGVSGVALRLKNVFDAPGVTAQLKHRETSKGYEVRNWTDQNKSLLSALALEKRVIFLVVLFIVVVAMLGISNTLAMWALEMRREMSLLRAVGTPNGGVGRLMLLEGLFVSGLGICWGLLPACSFPSVSRSSPSGCRATSITSRVCPWTCGGPISPSWRGALSRSACWLASSRCGRR
ncbi:MAG: ABC transporter permease [Bacteroidota bacterium]